MEQQRWSASRKGRRPASKRGRLAFVGLVPFLSVALLSCANRLDLEGPDQPIAFSHKTHAGQLKVDCQFCHLYARRSASAGVPSVKRCMGCHEVVESDSPAVRKLQEYWDRKEPIAWKKVYDLPDHVSFFHDRHVRAEVPCQDCHGDVGAMERVRQVKDLTMDECVQCHRQQKASVDCLACHH
ncbi:MAG: cytochrome c3 family protein [Acidobacteria bacterium]|nr:cytochrome c3 family protein [Acidobacteriota bacterium]